jgi:cytoskeletal protein CcmA (bactofilin family)
MAEQPDAPAKPGEDTTAGVGQLPHFALRAKAPRPPAKPFFKPATSAEKTMSEKAALERQSGDRSFIERMGVLAPTASYTPPPQRRATEIPNFNTVRALDAAGDGKKLVIGKQIRVSGEISGCEHLLVEGEIDAAVTGVSVLEVAAGARMAGSAEVDKAVIAGSFEGALTVREHLEIPSGGTVRGTIAYKTVSVTSGGTLAGTISVREA